MEWQTLKVLVTGAGGFIGSHLTERIAELGAGVRALVQYNSTGSWGWLDSSPVKNEVSIFMGDLRDRDSLRKVFKGVDMVFHLGALISIPYSYEGPSSYLRTNTEGTMNVLQMALDAGVRLVINTSTSEVYGTAMRIPIDEGHPLQGQSPYSASKIAADKMAEAYYLSFGLPVVTIRPFNTYGPRQSARAVIPTIITQALTQNEIRLGSLHPTRDLNYVKDTVEGFIRAAETPEAVGDLFNIGNGKDISIGGLAGKILGLMGKDIPIVCKEERLRPEKSEVERLCADNSKAKNILKWQPAYTIDQGLMETIQWIKDNLDYYKPDRYLI